MHRMLAIFERDMRRFRRSPALIMMSLIMPIAQLVVLGYAFGGQVKNLKLGVVNQDHRLPSVKLRELCLAVAANARTFETIDYSDPGEALTDLRNGRINGMLKASHRTPSPRRAASWSKLQVLATSRSRQIARGSHRGESPDQSRPPPGRR